MTTPEENILLNIHANRFEVRYKYEIFSHWILCGLRQRGYIEWCPASSVYCVGRYLCTTLGAEFAKLIAKGRAGIRGEIAKLVHRAGGYYYREMVKAIEHHQKTTENSPLCIAGDYRDFRAMICSEEMGKLRDRVNEIEAMATNFFDMFAFTHDYQDLSRLKISVSPKEFLEIKMKTDWFPYLAENQTHSGLDDRTYG